MNNLKKEHKLIRQNEQNVQKSQKHEANLQKNTMLYFQLGLVLCLLFSYAALEATFAVTTDKYVYTEKPEEVIDYLPPNYIVVTKPKQEALKPLKKIVEPEVFDVVKDNIEIEKAVVDIIQIAAPENPTTKEINPDDLIVEVPEEKMPNIMSVQKVPIYPGCESSKNNNERRQCMSNKLRKLIQKKFNSNAGVGLGLSGKQKINVAFKINKKGMVEVLTIRAPHKNLEKEAIRVINKIPHMVPGKNNNKPVNVSYMLPILFSVQ